MLVSIVIPSKGNISKLESLLGCINNQTFLPDKVYVVVDKEFTKDDFDVFTYFLYKQLKDDVKNIVSFVTNINSDFITGKGVSYVRNFGIKLSNRRG